MKYLFFIPSILLFLFLLPTYSLGECIEGDCQNGKGTYIYAKGNKYVGEWRDGKKHGQGTRTFPGQEYVGEFKNGLYDGQGTLTLSYNGKYYSKYVGEWKAGHPHGQETETYRVGAKYVGEWKDGKRHGQGTFTHLNGKIESGEWKDGELVKPN